MPMIVQRGRNPIVAAAFAGLRAAERKEKKQAPRADVEKIKADLRDHLVSPDQVKKAPAKKVAKRAPAKKSRARQGKARP